MMCLGVNVYLNEEYTNPITHGLYCFSSYSGMWWYNHGYNVSPRIKVVWWYGTCVRLCARCLCVAGLAIVIVGACVRPCALCLCVAGLAIVIVVRCRPMSITRELLLLAAVNLYPAPGLMK
jgi:hypothetical protein